MVVSYCHVAATIVHGALQIILLLWTPTPDREVLFYVIAAFWGMGDAVIQTQINGSLISLLYGQCGVCDSTLS